MTFIGLMTWKKRWCNKKNSTNKNNNKPLKLQNPMKTLRTLKNELDKWKMVKLEQHTKMTQMKMEQLQV